MHKPVARLKPRKKKEQLEDIPLSDHLEQSVQSIALSLSKQVDASIFNQKHAHVKEILMFIGAGAFVAASVAVPTLPAALKPFLRGTRDREAWKRFNIPYFKRIIRRLEQERLVEVIDSNGVQELVITHRGRRRVLKYALDDLAIKRPVHWDGLWRLVSYDIPRDSSYLRKVFREYLLAWGFYPLHESVFLHAYPCKNEVTFLREYLGIGELVRVFTVSSIENDGVFRGFFGV